MYRRRQTHQLDQSLIRNALAPKSKKSRKKKGGGKNKVDTNTSKSNGTKEEEQSDHEEEKEDLEDQAHNGDEPTRKPDTPHQRKPSRTVNGSITASADPIPEVENLAIEDEGQGSANLPEEPSKATNSSNTTADEEPTTFNGNTEAKLEALVRERSALRDEVAELRKSLEELQQKHNEDTANLKQELEETQSEKENADTQYRNLLGRVNTIRSQLGERLKSDAVRALSLAFRFQY